MMDAKQRAENLGKKLYGILGQAPYDRWREQDAIKLIASQIEEAEQEAFARGIGTECSKHGKIAWWCSGCGLESEDKRDKEKRLEGFRACQEKAAEIVRSGRDNEVGFSLILKALRRMEPGE